jgi:hypothetical protein
MMCLYGDDKNIDWGPHPPKRRRISRRRNQLPASGSCVGTVRRPHRVIPDKSVAFWPTRVMASCR